MSTRSLSVVICSIGRASVVPAIESVRASLEHAGADGEIVLVWQGRNAPRDLPGGVVVLHTIPAGLSHARNAGVEGSSSPRLAFIDDDELVAESWAAGVQQGFDEGADAVFGPVDPMDDVGRPHCVLTGEVPRWVDPHERPWNVGTGGNMAATRQMLAEVGGFDPRLGAGSFGMSAEDTFLIARLQRVGARLRWRPEMRVAHPTKTDAEVLASRYPYGFGAGRVVRRLRSAALAGRYTVDLGWAAREALRRRSRQRARELLATARGFVAGALYPDRWTAPEALLDRLPPELGPLLDGHTPRGLPVPFRNDPHFLYAIGDRRLLHVYGEPGPVKREARRARERLREGGLPAGIPALYGAVETPTELWLVEERLPGRAAVPEREPRWWADVTSLLIEIGRRTDGPVRAGSWWQSVREELPPALAPAWRAPVVEALEVVGNLPSVVAHGDVQPKNIVLDGGPPGLVDWDGALAEGPPALDLLFLAVTARSGAPDAEPLLALAHGRDVHGVPLLASLHAVGIDAARACAVALVAAATWAAAEAARASHPLGRDLATPSEFTRLLDDVGPALRAAQAQPSARMSA
jgi:hypothetical protein